MISDLGQSGAIPTLSTALRFASERQKLIAHNIANVSTPNFIQQDVSVSDFRAKLARAVDERRDRAGGEGGRLELPRSSEVSVRPDGRLQLRPSTPAGSVLFHDKNNRDVEGLMQDSVENATFYRVSVDFLRSRFEILRSAISQRP